MATKRVGKLDDATMDAAAEVPESVGTLTGGEGDSRFARARRAVDEQPNMPPLAGAKSLSASPAIAQNDTDVTEYRVVPLDLIDDNPYNARTDYNQEAIKELALSIGKDGQLQPGIATIRGDRYVLIGGHYRKKAISQTSLTTMKLVIRENVTDRDLYRLSFKENAERHPQSAIDNAFAWRKLLDNGVYAQDQDISDAIGVSKGQVSKTLTLLKMNEKLIDFVRYRPELGVSILYELYQLEVAASVETALEMADQVVGGHATRDDITNLRNKMTTQKPRKQHATSRQYLLKGMSGKLGIMKEWGDGRIVVELKIEDPAEREAFLDEIKLRFHAT